jgi:hypothetical protein
MAVGGIEGDSATVRHDDHGAGGGDPEVIDLPERLVAPCCGRLCVGFGTRERDAERADYDSPDHVASEDAGWL